MDNNPDVISKAKAHYRITNSIPADILRDYHRLTAMQINGLPGEGSAAEDAEGKAEALALTAALLQIADAFGERAVPFMALKGPLLALRLYDDVTARLSRDIDIMVRPQQLREASDILSDLGYEREAGWPEGERRQNILVRHSNEVEFIHRESGVVVELHWRLLKSPPISYARFGELPWENSMMLTYAGRAFTVLNNEMELLFLIMHGGSHWWRRLKWLADIHRFLQMVEFDADRFGVLAGRFRAERMTALCNELLKVYFGEEYELPGAGRADPFMLRFARERIESHSDPVRDFFGRAVASVRYNLVSYKGLRYKLRVFRNYLFVHSYYGRNKILSTLPLFYIYAPLKLLIRRAKV